MRELEERLGFGELIEQHLMDSRAKNAILPLADLLRQSAYNRLAMYEDVNDAQRLCRDPRIGNCSLTSLQQRLVKTGGRLVKHARYYGLLLAESHLTRRLFASMLGRIDGLSLPAG